MKTPFALLSIATTLALAATPAGADPSAWLTLHEEEYLARDLYAEFGAQHGLTVFANISRSEQRHIDAVAALLAARSIPVPPHLPGTFNDASLQAVYDQLASQGGESLIGALRAGALVEELDIADLDELLLQSDLAAQDRTVLANLRAASAQHLRAFVNNLAARGELYTPAILEDDAFAAIVEGPARGGPPRGPGRCPMRAGRG